MRELVNDLLQKINALTQQRNFPHLSSLELDLLQQYLRELYEHIEKVKKQTVSPSETRHDNSEMTVTRHETKASTDNNVDVKNTLKPTESVSGIHTSAPETHSEHTANKTTIDKSVPADLKNAKSEPHETSVSVSKTINELAGDTSSLNDKLKRNTRALNEKLSGASLKSLIDLNKRIAITSELFKGNSEAYQNALAALENCDAYEKAEATFQRLAEENGWKADSQTVRLFQKILRQRFGI
ncbi:MAG: hypothetical protein NZM35_02790 [Chitinophagales bacterium]|nr:hypothetical protein [Chitinophagales bacterium]MDW8418116.1 hypothetical protein [Chitinophagales bacterium]